VSARADIAARDGRYAEAIQHYETAWQIMNEMPGIVPMDAPCWLVWALAADGRFEEARQVLTDVRQMPDLERWQARPLLLDAAEALLDGDFVSVDQLVDSASSWLGKFDVGLMRLIGAAVATGETRVRWLRAALDVYDDLGIVPTAKRVRVLLRAEGAPVPRRRRIVGAVSDQLAERGVTARESEVLGLVGDGLSNAEIAEQLVVSVRTVEAHVSSLLTKLGVERRTQLVAFSAAPI
jgi:DNA-binding CsgD family transcriptional regulator